MAPEPTPPATLARSAASASAATLTSRLLGLVREQVIAAQFGAGAATDAYNVTFRIPNLLRDLFAEGAMSAAFVPTFTKELTASGRDAAWRLGRLTITALVIVSGALVVLGVVFAEPLVRLLADDRYTRDAAQLALTVDLARVMLPSLTLIAVAAAAMGMLNALRHFFVPALSPAMFNVLSIASMILLVPVMPALGLPAIMAVAIGTLLGAVAQVAIQWPALRREGFRYRPLLDWSDPGLRRVLLLMGPGTIGLAATQVNIFVNTHLATSQGDGPVSWLNYAFRLMYLPIGLFGVSIATAVLPAVARHSMEQHEGGVRDTVTSGMSLMLMLNVPATVGLVILAEPIVRLIFERGAFGPSDTAATAAALQFYALGLVGYSVVRIASPTFYALGRNRVPVIVSGLSVLVNASLNWWLVGIYGYRGLAFGTSIAALFNAAALLVILRRQLHGLHDARLLGALLRITLASLAMGAAAYGANLQLERWLPGATLVPQLARVSGSIAAALAVLAAASWLLRIDEFRRGADLVMRRFRRR